MLHTSPTNQHKHLERRVTPMLLPMPEYVMLELSLEEVRVLQKVLTHHLKYFEQEPAYKHISRCLRRIQIAMTTAHTVDNIVPEGD
jgi:hypothetical protein